MGRLSSMLDGLAKSFPTRKGQNTDRVGGGEAAGAMGKDAKKKDLILRTSASVNFDGSSNFASVCSKKGEKGVNQDCCIVWEEFGRREDMIFCGIFDGHGPWGHFVAKYARESMPSSLLCNWQEVLSRMGDVNSDFEKNHQRFELWKNSYIKTCAAIDQQLECHRKIDSFNSGTTALSIVRQGELIVMANVGDSRAVLATSLDNGSLAPVQLTVDFKPNLPQEAERIAQCNGRVFCLDDEPGVHRVWLPHKQSPGLAMSRALGDYCIKGFGLISVPEVTQRTVTNEDHFVILATDGVWDVISNQEAVLIVSSAPERAKSAKLLVKAAAQAWRRKRPGIARDDISAICLFLHPSH